jgi:hypothetical protein
VSPACWHDAEFIDPDPVQEHPMFGIIEEEQGTYTRTTHPHNGYYAGDFSGTIGRTPTASTSASVLRTTAHPTERGIA